MRGAFARRGAPPPLALVLVAILLVVAPAAVLGRRTGDALAAPPLAGASERVPPPAGAGAAADASRPLDEPSARPAGAARTDAADAHRRLEASWQLFASLAAGLLLSGLSLSVGVGGGFLWVPLISSALGFGLRASVALSQASMAAASVGAVAASYRHVDTDLAAAIVPAMLLGVSFGVLLNKLAPEVVTAALLVLLLLALAARTLVRATRLWKTETAARAAAHGAPRPAAAGGDAALSAPLVGTVFAVEDEEDGDVDGFYSDADEGAFSDAGEEQRPAPAAEAGGGGRGRAAALTLAWLWVAFTGLQIAKSRFGRCSWPWAAAWAAQATTCAAATAAALLRRGSDGVKTDDAPWPPRRLALAAGAGLAGGAAAAMVGMGGGTFLGPVLLEIGVAPRVAAATSMVLVLVSASAAATAYAAEGQMNVAYAGAFMPAAATGAVLGVVAVARAVRRAGRPSIVVALLGGITLAGGALTAAFAGRRALEAALHGGDVGFGSLCD